MKLKQFLSTVSLIFLILAIAHFIRVMNAVPVTVGSIQIPLWISYLAVVGTLYLSYQAMKFRV